MYTEDDLNVGCFYASPRHAHYFATNHSAQAKIARRVEELLQTGRIKGKTPIINIQSEPDLVELHDGNASVVAWLTYITDKRLAPSMGLLRRSFEEVIVLHGRRHDSGEIWHPFVPVEIQTATQLQQIRDAEQDRMTCKAINANGTPVYFNDQNYFSGVDSAEILRSMVTTYRSLPAPS